MMRRELDVDRSYASGASAVSAARPPITLISPPNWTAIVFFAALASLHVCIATTAFYNGRWEGYLSALLGCFFIAASILSYHARSVVRFEPARKCIRVRSGLGRLSYTRSIPFDDVHAVRLTLPSTGDASDSRIEVLCDNEDIDCPPTTIPRQEALYLAMMLDVQLIKVEASIDSDEDSIHPELNSRGL